MRTLIRGGRILTCDPGTPDLERGDLLIEGERIVAIAPSLPVTECEVIDAAGAIVLPGFVDAHRHVWQTQLRTVAGDWTLFDYFVRMRLMYSAGYRPGDVYLGNHVGALEALNAGITTLVDHSHIMNSPEHADEAVRGLEDAGVRALFCYGLFANPVHRPFRWGLDPEWRFQDARRIRAQRLPGDEGLVSFGIAPTEVEATSIDVTSAEIAFARELGARRISCHVALGRYDRGHAVVRGLAERGLLGEDLLWVHGAALSDPELDHIAESGGALVATPETELQMGMGNPIAFRAVERGIRTGLGVDVVSNVSGDMFSQMRLQLQAQRGIDNELHEAPPRSVSRRVREVLELATRGGARVAGLDDHVGSLTPGKQADLVLMRTDSINMLPAIDPVSAVVLQANVHDVDSVWVAGRARKRAGKLLDVDWPSLATRLRTSSTHLVEAFERLPRAEIEALGEKLMFD